MTPLFILSCIGIYFCFLLFIAWYTSRKADANSYFLGNKASPWYAVAFGMIGDSLSGVTFISVPGSVYTGHFSYLQVVMGYFVGYFAISHILLPIYYKYNLVSIYSYLQQRFGKSSQKTGSFFFILSRLLGAGGRLFLAASVIQLFVFDAYHIPFVVTVTTIILLILLYTYKGGIKTLVWTDTFQSTFLILGVVLSIASIANHLDFNVTQVFTTVKNSPYSDIFVWDWMAKNNFFKHFIGGAFIAIAMTGLDQNMMQKNLSCKSLGDAQKNIFWFSIVMFIVNTFFISLGALLYYYASTTGIDLPMDANGKVITDSLFPMLALRHLGNFAGIVFIIGLTAATFSSADSVLTSLTTSYYVDVLEYDQRSDIDDSYKKKIRTYIHIAFAVLLLMVIVLFKALNDKAIVETVLTLASYTYGPLLGLFAMGLFSKIQLKDALVPLVCIIAPVLCYILNAYSKELLGGYQIGLELILLNAFLTFLGLLVISRYKYVFKAQ